MKRRMLLLLFVGFFLVSCGSAKPRPDKNPVESRLTSLGLPMSVPEGTFAVLRMNLARADKAMGHFAELSKTIEDSPISYEYASKRFLAGMLGRPSELKQVVDAEGYPDAFPGLDRSGTVFAAVSVAGNEALLRSVTNSTPGYGVEMIPRGFFVRLHIPATDPEALAEWLDAACGNVLACPPGQKVEVRDGAVLVEHRIGDNPDVVQAAGAPIELPAPGADPLFDARDTAAFRVFAETDAAFGIHLVSARLGDAVALASLLDGFDAILEERSTTRDTTYGYALETAIDVRRTHSPGAREVADTTVLLRASDGFGYTVDGVQTLTELGRRVARAASASPGASVVPVDDPFVAVELGYDFDAATKAAVVPTWLDSSDAERAMDAAANIQVDAWTSLIPLHNYPIGFLRGAGDVLEETENERGPYGVIALIRGLRLAFDARPSDGAGPQLVPFGGLALTAGAESDVGRYMQTFGEAAPSLLPFTVDLDLVEVEGGKEARVTAGQGVTFGEQKPVEGIAVATVDLAAMGELIAGIRGGDPESTAKSAALYKKLSQARLDARRVEAAVYARLTLADSEVPRLDHAGSVQAVAQPDAVPRCLNDVRRFSQRANVMRGRVRQSTLGDFFDQVEERLKGAEADCAEGEKDIRWMRGQWKVQRGITMAKRQRWERAAAAFSESCELDGLDACPWTETLRRVRSSISLPTVSEAEGLAVKQQSPITAYVSDSVVRSGPFSSMYGLSSNVEYEYDALSLEDAESRSRATGLLFDSLNSEVGGFHIAAAGDADAAVVARLVGWVGSQDMKRLLRATGHQDRLRSPVVLPILTENGERGSLPFAPASVLGEPVLRVEIEAESEVDVEAIIEKAGTLENKAHVAIVVEEGVTFQRVVTAASRLRQALSPEGGTIYLSLDTP